MKGKSALLAGAAVIAFVASAHGGYAASDSASSGPSNAELAARLQALEDELQAYESKSSSDHGRLSALEQNFNDTSWTFDNARPTVKSGDGRFTMAIRVRFQFDDANFMQDSGTQLAASAPMATKDLSSGAVVRRAFFGVEGKAFKDFFYEFRLNAGGTSTEGIGNLQTSTTPVCTNSPTPPTPCTTTNAVTSATLNAGDPLVSLARVAYVGIDHFELNMGVIEPAFMFEGTTSSGGLMFLERPEIDNIAADTFGAADSRRGIEVRFQKDGALMPGDNLVLNAAFTGSKTGTAAGHGPGGDEQSQLLGRASYRFWSDGVSNASFGGSAASVLNSGTSGSGGSASINLQDRPEIRVDGTRLIATGGISAQHAFMYAFDGGVNFENFFLGGEYANFEVDRLAAGARAADKPSFSGWYVEGSWVLTGEPKTYTVSATNNEVGGFGAPRVASPFSLAGDSWGAWELAARYSETDLNWMPTTAATATAQAGINGGQERVIDLGVNWYLNNNVKLQLNDLITTVDKFSSTTHSHANNAGQDFNTLAVRLQFTN